jgi:hypothetical protein
LRRSDLAEATALHEGARGKVRRIDQRDEARFIQGI